MDILDWDHFFSDREPEKYVLDRYRLDSGTFVNRGFRTFKPCSKLPHLFDSYVCKNDKYIKSLNKQITKQMKFLSFCRTCENIFERIYSSQRHCNGICSGPKKRLNKCKRGLWCKRIDDKLFITLYYNGCSFKEMSTRLKVCINTLKSARLRLNLIPRPPGNPNPRNNGGGNNKCKLQRKNDRSVVAS